MFESASFVNGTVRIIGPFYEDIKIPMKDFIKNSVPSLVIALVIILVWEIYLRIFSPQVGESIYSNGISLTMPDKELGFVLAPNGLNIHYNREFYPDYKK